MIDIIFITHNQLEFTKLCLKSLIDNTKEAWRLIWIEQGSTDGTLDYGKNFVAVCNHLDIVFIENKKNEFISKAFNQGIAKAKSDILLFINNDLLFAPGAIDKLVNFLREHKEIAVVFPSFTRGEEPNDFPNNTDRAQVGSPYFCTAIKKEVFEKIGGFDERFLLWYGDIDFDLRMKQASFRSAGVPESYVHHFESRTWKAVPLAGKIIEEDARRFQEKHAGKK